MNQNDIKRVYENRLFSQVPLLHKENPQLNYILKYLSKEKNISILDAGCGNGNYSFYLSSLGYLNISAVDLFNDINTEKFHYRQESIDKLSFKNESFDFIYSNSVIYYLENPEDGVKEFNRVLNNNGILFITAHTKYSLFTLWRIIQRDLLKSKKMEHLNGVKFYSASYYKDILEKNGFEIILQDGYKVSFFIYPFYKKVTKVFNKLFNIMLPSIKPYKNSNIIGKIKSEISYHSVFVARKRSDQNKNPK